MGPGASPPPYVSFPGVDCIRSLGFFGPGARSVGPLFRGRWGRGRSSGASTRRGCERSAPLRPPGRRPRPQARWFGPRCAVLVLALSLSFFSFPFPLSEERVFVFFPFLGHGDRGDRDGLQAEDERCFAFSPLLRIEPARRAMVRYKTRCG